jgi:hypothetical protein
LQHLSKSGVAEVSVGIYKLRLVEQVENIRPELEVFGLGNCKPLREGDIPLVFSRSAADRTRGGGESAEGGIGELSRVQVEIVVLLGIENL